MSSIIYYIAFYVYYVAFYVYYFAFYEVFCGIMGEFVRIMGRNVWNNGDYQQNKLICYHNWDKTLQHCFQNEEINYITLSCVDNEAHDIIAIVLLAEM